MSEVKRYFMGSVEMVPAVDFDRVTAERDAALESLRIERGVLGVANETIASLAGEVQGLQQRLTAADDQLDDCGQFQQRQIAVIHNLNNQVELLNGLLRECLGYLTLADCVSIRGRVKGALKLSDAGDSARLSLRLENQRITPARFKCLACGEYHEGSGNLTCPSMSPYSRIEQ